MSNFRNVQDGGNWVVGGTYTFEVWYRCYDVGSYPNAVTHAWGMLPSMSPVVVISVETKTLVDSEYVFPDPPTPWYQACWWNYTDWIEGTGVVECSYSENWETGFWATITVTIPIDFTPGSYKLCHLNYSWHYVPQYNWWIVETSSASYYSITISGVEDTDPEDEEEGVDVGKPFLSWNTNYTPPYDVYFGPTGEETLVSEEQTATNYQLPILEYDKEYTWWINDEGPWKFWTMPFYIPKDRVTNKRLVAAAANTFWYENV